MATLSMFGYCARVQMNGREAGGMAKRIDPLLAIPKSA